MDSNSILMTFLGISVEASVKDLVKKKKNSRQHGFKFSFDDIFNSNDQDDDEDSVFQAGNNGFGGFGFGDNLFSFGSESHTFTKTERRSSGGQRCKTITKKMGNMVTTFTECS